jgi:hypothetical protein
MALANVAWILASNGRRVLALDWDLEAPGLHRYFLPFLVDRELTVSPGIIDFVLDYTLAAMTPPEEKVEPGKDWYLPYTNILRYAVSLDWPFPGQGRLDFIPAGRQVASYSTRVNSFNWQDFYTRLGGRAFLDSVKERMRSEYDYVLIDSRTGVSDSSGICTIQMPDALVVCHTLNNQSVKGAAAVAASVQVQRHSSPLRILPVPMRVENAEKDKRDLRREEALACFTSLGLEYSRRIQFPYIPYYAYEEILSTFGDAPDDTGTFLESCERLTGLISEGQFNRLQVTQERNRREEVLKAYAAGNIVHDANKAQESSFLARLAINFFSALSRSARRAIYFSLLFFLLCLSCAVTWRMFDELEKSREGSQRLKAEISELRNSKEYTKFDILSARCSWKSGSTDAIEIEGEPGTLASCFDYKVPYGFNDYAAIVAVGLASCEGSRDVEIKRAEMRSYQLKNMLRRSPYGGISGPALYSLNLGRYEGPCSGKDSFIQRKVVIVGIDFSLPQIRENLRTALRRSFDLDVDNYSSFDLAPVKEK